MVRSLSNLAVMANIQKNTSTKVRLVGLININTTEMAKYATIYENAP